jgi:fucose 4-O-acetylase-like acetyltransferase
MLLVIGQNSLFVYILHAVIVSVFKFFIPAKTNALQNFAITSLALALLISGTYAYRYIRTSLNRPGAYSFWKALRERAQIAGR